MARAGSQPHFTTPRRVAAQCWACQKPQQAPVLTFPPKKTVDPFLSHQRVQRPNLESLICRCEDGILPLLAPAAARRLSLPLIVPLLLSLAVFRLCLFVPTSEASQWVGAAYRLCSAAAVLHPTCPRTSRQPSGGRTIVGHHAQAAQVAIQARARLSASCFVAVPRPSACQSSQEKGRAR